MFSGSSSEGINDNGLYSSLRQQEVRIAMLCQGGGHGARAADLSHGDTPHSDGLAKVEACKLEILSSLRINRFSCWGEHWACSVIAVFISPAAMAEAFLQIKSICITD